MQQDPKLQGLALEVHILGINGIGQEAGNSLMTDGRTIPWLQDDASVDVWSAWHVTYRDVVILDGLNRPVGVYNLTVHDLSVQANRDELRDLLIQAASAPASAP